MESVDTISPSRSYLLKQSGGTDWLGVSLSTCKGRIDQGWTLDVSMIFG